jgi:hypothetical protein
MRLLCRLSIVFVGIFLSLLNAGVVMAEASKTDHQHSHAADEHTASGLSLDQGKKWETDAALRRGMKSINDAAMEAVPAYHHDELTKADAEKLAKHIDQQVSYLVANCTLEPGADATLHVLIGDLLTAAARMSNDPLSPQGLPNIVKALQQYPDYFDHQGWHKMTEGY